MNMRKKTRNTWVLILIVVLVICAALFIFTQMSVIGSSSISTDTYGLTCNGNLCSNSKTTSPAVLEALVFMYKDSRENYFFQDFNYQPYNDVNYVINKTCWVEVQTPYGLMKAYGHTSGIVDTVKNTKYGYPVPTLAINSPLYCRLVRDVPNEYIFLNDKFVYYSNVEGSDYMKLKHFTGAGANKLAAGSIEAKIDFSTSEFPPQVQVQPQPIINITTENNTVNNQSIIDIIIQSAQPGIIKSDTSPLRYILLLVAIVTIITLVIILLIKNKK